MITNLAEEMAVIPSPEVYNSPLHGAADATIGRIVLGLKDYHPGAGGVLQFDNARVVESEN